MNRLNEEIKEKLRSWAIENKDIICVFIGGSQSNKKKVLDEYSDIDVVVFARRRKHYDKDLSWISRLGELASYHEERVAPLISCVHKIYFTNGARLDLLFWDRRVLLIARTYLWLQDRTKLLRLLPAPWKKTIEIYFGFFPKYIYRGFTMVVDKRNYRPKMEYIGRKANYQQSPFSLNRLQFIINQFWAYAYNISIDIVRNELMHAKLVGDSVMKWRLLELIQMYMKCKYGEDFDVFDDGRYLEKWAPDFIVERLKNIYGWYEANDAWRAAGATMDLFSLICEVLAKEYPDIKFSNPEQHFRKLIQEIDSKRMVHAL